MADKPNVQVNDANMTTTYANAFRQHANQHEVIVDLGVNVASKGEDGQVQMQFTIDNRMVMNYVTAKRLAGMLVQVVQAHEKQFGEIKAN
ncbi:MAG: DUF3467 domain-containing protein [Phycisphaeraceae bacterium]